VIRKLFRRRTLILSAIPFAALVASVTAASVPAMATVGRPATSGVHGAAGSVHAVVARAAGARVEVIRPGVSPDTALFITYLPEGNQIGYGCDSTYNYNFPYVPITGFTNECEERVWLHEVATWPSDPSAWTYCISPGQHLAAGSLQSKYQYPQNIYISDNPNPCP
jgi:hypothetical protein